MTTNWCFSALIVKRIEAHVDKVGDAITQGQCRIVLGSDADVVSLYHDATMAHHFKLGDRVKVTIESI